MNIKNEFNENSNIYEHRSKNKMIDLQRWEMLKKEQPWVAKFLFKTSTEELAWLNGKIDVDKMSTEEAERTARSFTKNHRLMKETKLRTATVKGTLLDDLRALVSA